ncbi:L-lactate MFS transporter [Anaerotignum propionicum]|uniref:MFS-type transporter YhjX n=1 Tax=Anaerotignum propionicum DSM 1682 TaxID=991789 RepID=A0A0X1U8R7_ANAPI|nr:OFA family MFS transporter [Anaerotignum propionicum]AMJ41326.1 putative MFS-type transporter YhjX [Anaerotignum propionicum DSM 1682]SHE97121.1 Sugar phosphate permease [[Clostridium] propionicum DSM 1682] [Anaerotignum propionicum DSM 1682]
MKLQQMKLKEALKYNKRWVYIVLGIIFMMFLGTVYSYSVFRVALEKDLMIGAAESGMPYMVALAFYALFMFLTGRYIEKFQAKKILILGGLLVSLGWILSSFVSNIFLLTITYGCISGAGVGIAYGVPLSVIAKWFPDKKGIAVGLILIGFGLSPLVTAPIARSLVESYGVMKTFFILGVSFAVMLPILAILFKYPSDEEVLIFNKKVNQSSENSRDLTLKQMIRTKSFKGVYLNFLIGTMIGLMVVGMTINVGLDYFQLDSPTVTRTMAIFAIFNGVGRPAFGWVTDRYSSRKAMTISYFLIMSSAMGLVTSGKHTLVYILTFSIFWFNLGGWLAIAPTSTLKLYGIKNNSQNYGLVFTAYGVGAIAGVSTSGLILDYYGNYDYVFYYIIVLCMVGIILTTKYINNKTEKIG